MSVWVRTVGIALAASALTLLLTSGLVGAQSGGSNQIHACAGDRGAMRLVATDESCNAGENRVVWNAEGVQGAQGGIGPQGPPGAKGAPGKKGLRGKPGKAKLRFTGDLATQVLLKKLDKKLTALGKSVTAVKGKVAYTQGYLQSNQFGVPTINSNARGACLNASFAYSSIHTHEFDTPPTLPPVDCK